MFSKLSQGMKKNLPKDIKHFTEKRNKKLYIQNREIHVHFFSILKQNVHMLLLNLNKTNQILIVKQAGFNASG